MKLPRGGVALPPWLLNLAVAVWLLALLNRPFWEALWAATGGWEAARAPWLVSLPVVVLLWVWLVLELLTWGRAARPVLAAVLVVSAVLAFFMDHYGIVFDRTMLRNVLETDVAETRELLSLSMAGWVAAFGVLPAALLAWCRPVKLSWRTLLVRKAGVVLALAVSFVAIVVAFSSSYASLLRNHRDLRLQLVPSNVLAAVHSYLRASSAAGSAAAVVAADARRATGLQASGRPLLLVLAVGETTRSANWGLDGYARDTTPALRARTGVVNLGPAAACGTSTAVSLPCMFLDRGRDGYEDGLANRRENLLDTLRRAGVDVVWIDNNSGCKGLCDRVETERIGDCGPDGCLDDTLVEALRRRVDSLRRDTVVVLHLKGQHGPAYFKRYPPSAASFSPVCREVELDRCSRQQVVNAYDNAVRYTDQVLGSTIDLLDGARERVDSALLFISDHGESLGEKGLYLHGMPYGLAPREQTHVPFTAWFGAATVQRLGLDLGCLASRAGSLSHDALYPAVLSLTGVQTSLYRPEADPVAPCMAARPPAPTPTRLALRRLALGPVPEAPRASDATPTSQIHDRI